MLKYGIAVLILVLAIGAVDAQPGSARAAEHSNAKQATPAADTAPNGRPFEIRNKVIDLLDGEVVLDAATEQATWQSRPFDTAQFNRVGIRVVTQEDSDPVLCSLWWQFTPDDEFLPGPPSAAQRFIGDDSRLEPISVAPIGFSEIFGLRARAVCQLYPYPDFGRTDPPPPPASAVVTDVKVLLRRE
jgi:hypothetical protein